MLKELMESLTPAQNAGINLLKLSLNCFNSKDGTGIFTGPERYNVLAGRVEIVAVQAENLPRFWALLLRRMNWPVPPKWADEKIVEAISAPDGVGVLRVLATETASCITLARMLHDEEKKDRKARNVDMSDVDEGETCAIHNTFAGHNTNIPR